MSRTYEQTHPWISLQFDLHKAPYRLWLRLGEVVSRCKDMKREPIHPQLAAELRTLFVAKGVLATTAIEGNTLTEEQVKRILDKSLELPPSQRYLQQQIENVLNAYNALADDILAGQKLHFTPEWIAHYQHLIMQNLPVDEEVIPGEYRRHEVRVGRYLAVPPADCVYLVDKLCDWLNTPVNVADERYPEAGEILKAIIGHLYLAWIHPFADGNGRMARLLEFAILLHAGLPDITVHLLSNHYNKTREEYYRQLDYASRSGGNIFPFIEYALQGFVDGLDEQIMFIQAHQIEVMVRDLIHRSFDDRKQKADQRRKDLALAISVLPTRIITIEAIPDLNAKLARAYAGKTRKTIQRDLNELLKMNLIMKHDVGYQLNLKLLSQLRSGRTRPKPSTPGLDE
jgi:Fic family protein